MKRMIGPLAVGTAAISVAFGSSAAAASPANHDTNATSIRDRDNNDHNVIASNLEQRGNVACIQGNAELDQYTDIVGHWNVSGDVTCYDDNYGASLSWAGQTFCSSVNWTLTKCDTYNVSFNLSKVLSNNDWKQVGCHELGHTASIGHRTAADDSDNNSCMYFAVDPSRGYHYDFHDVNAINASG